MKRFECTKFADWVEAWKEWQDVDRGEEERECEEKNGSQGVQLKE